jgi:hypothetical protein
MIWFARPLLLLVMLGGLVLAAGVAPLGGVAQTSPQASFRRSPQTTALLVTATNAPRRLPASDGVEHLRYDLIVTNLFSAPVTLTAIEALAPDGGSLLSLTGETLSAVTRPVSGGEPTDQVPAGSVVAIQVELTLLPGQVPGRVSHRLTYDLPADARGRALISGREITGPDLTIDPRLPIVIAPPLRGAGWLSPNPFHGSGTLAVDGARYVKPEQFAVDWVRLVGGRPFVGDGARPEQWFGFGSDVLAVADGTVAFVLDGLPEGTPGRLPTNLEAAAEYAGNQVVLQIAPDAWVTYAHLQPGSLRVRVGERVRTGQTLGKLGNSGNSFAPHLHFQLSDSPPTAETGAIVAANSLPFVLDRYTLAGTVDPAVLVALMDPSASPEPVVLGPPRPQAGSYPLDLTVVDFP